MFLQAFKEATWEVQLRETKKIKKRKKKKSRISQAKISKNNYYTTYQLVYKMRSYC